MTFSNPSTPSVIFRARCLSSHTGFTVGIAIMAPIAGVSLLNRVLQRVWEVNQSASVRSQEEYELGSIVLRLLAQTLEHLRGVTNPLLTIDSYSVTSGNQRLDAACFVTWGCSFDTFRDRTMQRISAREWEIARCIPDYDPAEKISAQATRRGTLRQLQKQSGEGKNGRPVGMQLVPAQAGRKTGTLP